MNNEILLYTLPQWFIFAGIIASVYGWVEHKKHSGFWDQLFSFFLESMHCLHFQVIISPHMNT